MKYDLQALVEIFFRRQRVFLMAAAWAGAAIFALLMLCPPFYTSQAEILVQQNREQLRVSPTLESDRDTTQTVANTPPAEQDLNSELEMLTSQYLIEQALAGLTPQQTLAQRAFELISDSLAFPRLVYGVLHGAATPPANTLWAKKVRRHLGGTLLKRSNVIELKFTSHDAQWSRDFLTRLIDHYLELRAAISHDPEAEKFFNAQAALRKAKLEHSEDNLRALKLQTGVSDLPDQQKDLVDRLGGFHTEYQNNSSSLAGAQQRVAYLSQQLGSYPQHVDSETKIVQNQALQTLKPLVLQLQTERAELLTRYLPDSERIKEVDAKLASATALLHREDTREVQEVSSTINPTWQTLATDLAEAKAAAATLSASQTELAKQIADTEHQLAELTNASAAIERLEREVETDKEAYLSYVRKGEEARAAKALNLSKILNASVSSPPSLPDEPVFPSLPIDIYAGLAIALGCGLFFVYLSESRDPFVCSPQSAAAAAGSATVVVLEAGQTE